MRQKFILLTYLYISMQKNLAQGRLITQEENLALKLAY